MKWKMDCSEYNNGDCCFVTVLPHVTRKGEQRTSQPHSSEMFLKEWHFTKYRKGGCPAVDHHYPLLLHVDS
jgi:hypothetical protein